MTRRKSAAIVAVVVMCAAIVSPARAEPLRFGPHDVASLDLTLPALTSRTIEVETKPLEGRCEAWSQVRIGGERGYLYNVYVKVWLLGVDYLMLSGWATDRTRLLHEKIAR